MFIIGNSNLILAVCGLFAVGFLGFLGGAFKVITSVFGKKKGTSTATVNFQKQLAEQKRQFEAKMTQQAEQSKKTMMFIGIGAVVFIMMMFMFMRKK